MPALIGNVTAKEARGASILAIGQLVTSLGTNIGLVHGQAPLGR